MTWGIQYRATDGENGGAHWHGGLRGQRTFRMERAGIEREYASRDEAVIAAVRFLMTGKNVTEVRVVEDK